MPRKYLICDLDGTLLNSTEIVTSAMAKTLKEALNIELPYAELLTFLGPPLADTLGRYARAHGESETEIIKLYRKHYEGQQVRLRFFAEAMELLDHLRGADVRLAIATSKPQHATDAILSNLCLRDRFDSVNAAQDDRPHGKGPLVGAALAQWGWPDPDHVFMLGDRIFDIAGAAEHNVRTIVVTWGETAQPDEIDQAWAQAATASEVIALVAPDIN